MYDLLPGSLKKAEGQLPVLAAAARAHDGVVEGLDCTILYYIILYYTILYYTIL